MSGALEESFEHCRRVVRERARNFYFGLRLTPEPRRSAIYAAYAWMRAADDLADEPDPGSPDAAAVRLAAFRAHSLALADAAAAHAPPPDDPAIRGGFWPALHHILRAYPIRRPWLVDLLDGMDEDLRHTGYDSPADLLRYCGRVGSVPGLIAVAIWGLRDPRASAEQWHHALSLAHERGLAFQLTNILRDLAADAHAGRCYIPRSLLRSATTPWPPAPPRPPSPADLAVVAHLADLAHRHYTASAPLDDLIAPDCRRVLRTMTDIYQAILHRILTEPALAFSGAPVRVSTPRKLFFTLRALTLA